MIPTLTLVCHIPQESVTPEQIERFRTFGGDRAAPLWGGVICLHRSSLKRQGIVWITRKYIFSDPLWSFRCIIEVCKSSSNECAFVYVLYGMVPLFYFSFVWSRSILRRRQLVLKVRHVDILEIQELERNKFLYIYSYYCSWNRIYIWQFDTHFVEQAQWNKIEWEITTKPALKLTLHLFYTFKKC